MSTCKDCIEADQGCCSTFFIDGWKIILLPEEARRISKFTGKALSEFINIDSLVPSQLEYYTTRGARQDPLWAQLISMWTHPIGIKNYCPFLNNSHKAGCSLSYRVKPFLCQIYPIYFSITNGSFYMPKNPGCPVAQNARTIDEILVVFNDDLASLQQAFNIFRLGCMHMLKKFQKHRIVIHSEEN